MAGSDDLLEAVALRLAVLVLLGFLVKSLPDAAQGAAACVPAAAVAVGSKAPEAWEHGDKLDQSLADMLLHD